MVDAQLTAAFKEESRVLLDLHRRLAPQRRLETQELARRARATRDLRAEIARLQQTRVALQRRHDDGARTLAASATRAWWSWARLGRPLTIVALLVVFLSTFSLLLSRHPLVLFAAVAVFAMGASLTAPPRARGEA